MSLVFSLRWHHPRSPDFHLCNLLGFPQILFICACPGVKNGSWKAYGFALAFLSRLNDKSHGSNWQVSRLGVHLVACLVFAHQHMVLVSATGGIPGGRQSLYFFSSLSSSSSFLPFSSSALLAVLNPLHHVNFGIILLISNILDF